LKIKTILIMLAILAVCVAGYFIFFNKGEPEEPYEEPREYVWGFEMEVLYRIEIILPKEDMSQAWVKHEDRLFYFDEPDGVKVDMERWGGGIPLILSGPGAERSIVDNATDEQLTIFGFDGPNMEINLTLDDETVVNIEVGDSNPNGTTYYVKRVDSNKIYTVDTTWYEVLERLVLEPPYPPEEPEE